MFSKKPLIFSIQVKVNLQLFKIFNGIKNGKNKLKNNPIDIVTDFFLNTKDKTV